MKRFGLLLAVTAIIISGAAADQIDGRTVLHNMMEAEKTAVYIANEVTYINEFSELRSEQTIYHAGMKGNRIEYTSPAKLRGMVIADNGSQSIFYNPKMKKMTIGPSWLGMMGRHRGMPPPMPRGGPNAEIKGIESVAGRQAYVVEIKPPFGPKRFRRIWIDKERWIHLKTEELTEDGQVKSRSFYKTVKFVRDIPASRFTVKPGSDVQVEQMPGPVFLTVEQAKNAVRFRILQPSYLPKGFKTEGAAVIPFRGGKIIGLRYSDGVNAFTIFQSPQEVLEPGFLRRLHEGPIRSGGEMYSWRNGNLNLTIVGKIPPSEIKRISDSMN